MRTLSVAFAVLLCALPMTGLASTTDYDCEKMQRAARASRAAYTLYEEPQARDPSLLARFAGTPKLGGFAILRQGKGGWCEMAFKGTDITDPEDVLLDLAAAIPAQCGRRGKEALGVCAAGFFVQYLSIRNTNRLFSVLTDVRSKGHCQKGLLVTGHSLGGALASIFAADAVNRDPKMYGKKRMKVVTFAEPRVFGVKPAERFHRLIDKDRVVNYGDKIAAVPMVNLGFKHFGRTLFLKEKLLGTKNGRLVIQKETVDFAPEHAGFLTLLYHALTAYEIRLALCSP